MISGLDSFYVNCVIFLIQCLKKVVWCTHLTGRINVNSSLNCWWKFKYVIYLNVTNYAVTSFPQNLFKKLNFLDILDIASEARRFFFKLSGILNWETDILWSDNLSSTTRNLKEKNLHLAKKHSNSFRD